MPHKKDTAEPTGSADPLDILTRYRSTITPQGGGPSLYLRALSDDERVACERYALRASYTLRKALKTEGSDEYIAHLGFLEDASDDELREVIVLQTEMIGWVRAYRASPNPPLVVSLGDEPASVLSDDPLEGREEALLAPESADQTALEAAASERRRIVDALLAETETRLKETVRPLLQEEATKLIVQAQANARYQAAATHALVCACTYSDAGYTAHAFALGDWLPADLVAQLESKYQEVGAVSPAFLTAQR